MDHLSILIVHYNSEPETNDCLQSLAVLDEPKGFKYSVIVVDNASREIYQLPSQLSTNTFEILRSESNLGFTGGNNLGVTHALKQYNSDFLVLLNSDTTVDPAFLNHLYHCAKSSPRIGVLSPKILFSPGREYHQQSYSSADQGHVLWYAGGSIDWSNLVAFHRGVDEVDRGQFDHQETSDFATGCCLLIKREVIEKIGLLDERFFLYLEDVDWCVRTKEAGYSVGFCPSSVIWHKNAGSTGGSGSELQQYYQTRNRLLFGLIHGTWRQRLTTIAFLRRLLMNGARAERIAVTDLLTGHLGKRVVI